MDDLSDYLTNRRARGSSSYRALATLLQPFGSEYHLVVIDSPPGERMLQINALTAARCAVIPTKSDSRSLDGLEKVARLFSFVREGDDHMRELNPELVMLGVVVFGVGTASRAIRREAREKVARMFQDESVPFHTVPRHVEKIAVSTREHGLLVHEVEAETARRVADEDDPMSTASGLAADYEHLTAEILERWQAIRQPVAGAAGVTR
jgi:cellulose biosynthesis protein BcsQ